MATKKTDKMVKPKNPEAKATKGDEDRTAERKTAGRMHPRKNSGHRLV